MVMREGIGEEFSGSEPILTENFPFSFSTLAPLDSNVESLESGLLFANGLLKHCAVVGPSGWGKTHLLEAIAERCRQRGFRVERRSLVSFLADPVQYDDPGILLLDDAQEVLGKRKRRDRLSANLEARVVSGKPTFLSFTAPKMTRAIRSLIPKENLWQLSGITTPPPDQRLAILARMSQAQHLTLSPLLATIICHHLCGNGRTLSGALNRLKMEGDTWLGSQATLRACGLLEPLFADNGEWDLARNIIAIAQNNQPLLACAPIQDLCLYTLLHICELGEMDVARAMNLEPAKVYTRANRFRRGVSMSAESADCVSKFTELVVSQLARTAPAG